MQLMLVKLAVSHKVDDFKIGLVYGLTIAILTIVVVYLYKKRRVIDEE